MAKGQIKLSADRIAAMNRRGLVRFLRGLDCGFEMDFTDEFLKSLSLGRLRHIVLAAISRARNVKLIRNS